LGEETPGESFRKDSESIQNGMARCVAINHCLMWNVMTFAMIGMPPDLADNPFFSHENVMNWINLEQYKPYVHSLVGQSGD
jgi:hypothetical protein